MKHSNSNWNLYRCFLVVFETKNLHRAAEILGLSRSTVGSNIQALSDQIGAKLFSSSRKGVEPTSEAMTLYPSIKKAVDLIIESEENVQEFNRDTKAVIRLSVFSSFASYYMQKCFKDFCERYPNISFEFFGRGGYDLLAQKKIDFIIDFDYFFKPYNFKTKFLCTLSGAFIASKKFLARRGLSDTISKETLKTLPIISQRELWADFIDTNDFPTDIFMYSASAEFGNSMARNNLGVTYYFNEFFDNLNDTEMVRLKVEDTTMPISRIVYGYNNHLTKPAKAFLDGLTKLLSSSSHDSHKESNVL